MRDRERQFAAQDQASVDSPDQQNVAARQADVVAADAFAAATQQAIRDVLSQDSAEFNRIVEQHGGQ